MSIFLTLLNVFGFLDTPSSTNNVKSILNWLQHTIPLLALGGCADLFYHTVNCSIPFQFISHASYGQRWLELPTASVWAIVSFHSIIMEHFCFQHCLEFSLSDLKVRSLRLFARNWNHIPEEQLLLTEWMCAEEKRNRITSHWTEI